MTQKALILTLITMITAPLVGHAADADGTCLRVATRHCSGIAEAFGKTSQQYYECVGVRQNRCLESQTQQPKLIKKPRRIR